MDLASIGAAVSVTSVSVTGGPRAHMRRGLQEWSGHPCNWHVSEPVEVGDYQVAQIERCAFVCCPRVQGSGPLLEADGRPRGCAVLSCRG